MFSGLMNSFKGFMGWDTLEVTAGGNNEEKVQNTNIDERQSLFKQLSGFIGKDITSMISLPVWVFEPFSFLQVMCEPLQFDELLLKAASAQDPCHRIAYLSAWVIAGYSCAVRNKKPFNPLLGETFEYVHPEHGWKFVAEQVSHHPPIGVARVHSDKFILEIEMELKTKFTGNSSDVIVMGGCHFRTTDFNDHFTWNHLETSAHNIIIGGMWVDHFGTLEVVNHTTKDKCVLKASRSGWLGAGRFEVQGEVIDGNGNPRLKMNGKWNDTMFATKLNADGTPQGEPILLWKRGATPPNKWNWTKFNDELNTVDPEYEAILPPTDSRLRTDRRALQKDDLSLAGKEKYRLEEEQRNKRKDREVKGEHYQAALFKSVDDTVFGHKWEYYGNYWEQRDERVKQLADKKKAATEGTSKTEGEEADQ
jgi:hypothetical protein